MHFELVSKSSNHKPNCKSPTSLCYPPGSVPRQLLRMSRCYSKSHYVPGIFCVTDTSLWLDKTSLIWSQISPLLTSDCAAGLLVFKKTVGELTETEVFKSRSAGESVNKWSVCRWRLSFQNYWQQFSIQYLFYGDSEWDVFLYYNGPKSWFAAVFALSSFTSHQEDVNKIQGVLNKQSKNDTRVHNPGVFPREAQIDRKGRSVKTVKTCFVLFSHL